MSNFIPPAAISAAASAALRPANEAAIARKAQQTKNDIRAQDVEDVDETGVDTVGDDAQKKDHQQQHPSRQPPEDKVEIASLDPALPASPPPAPHTKKSPPPRLDISA